MAFPAEVPETWFSGFRKRTPDLARPLTGLTAVFILGLLAGARWDVALPVLLAAGFIFLTLALLVRRAALSTLFLQLVVFCVGWAAIALEIRPLAANELVNAMARDRERVRVTGVVMDDPVQVVSGSGENAWRFPVRVEALDRAGGWRKARGLLEVRWTPEQPGENVRYGERWLFEGPALRRDAEAGQPAVVWLSLRGDGAQRLEAGGGFWLRAWCLEGRRACARLLGCGLEEYPDAVGLMRAFMLGYREALPERANRAFSRTGTLHIAAISGAHVVILAGLLLVPLKALRFAQTRWILVMGPLLVLYALGTGLAASAVRACIMACVFWSAYAFRRRPDGPSALAFSALLILSAEPSQLWDAGFLLSFGVVAGLMLLVGPLSEPWLARLRPEMPGRPTWGQKARQVSGRYVISLVAVSVAAWLTSLPMTAQYFNLFSPVGLAANLLVVPLASLILLNGCLILIVGWFSALGAEIFNHASRVLVDVLLLLVGWFHRWPGGYCFVPAPWWGFSLAWYAGLIALARGRGRLRWWVGGLALVVILANLVWIRLDSRAVIAATPMGRGVAVLVEGAHEDGILVDPGPERTSRALIRWLRTRGVDRLQAVVLTQSTMEGASALPALLAEVPVAELWVPGSPVRSPGFTALVEEARAAGLTIRLLGRGDRLVGPQATQWQVLHPATNGAYANAGQGCLIIRVSQGPASVLLAGAARTEWQAELLAQPMDVAAGGLLVTRWDERSAWDGGWLDQVRAPWRVRPPGLEDLGGSPEELMVAEDETSRWRLSSRHLVEGPWRERWR